MDQEQIIRIAKKYAESVTHKLPVQKIVLYGSFANGTATEDSDIDIAVIVDSITEDVLTAKAKLYKLRRNIDDRIEPLLIESHKDPSGFLENVLTTGKVIFESKKYVQ